MREALPVAFRNEVRQRAERALIGAVGELGDHLAGAVRELLRALACPLESSAALDDRVDLRERNAIVVAVTKNLLDLLPLGRSGVLEGINQRQRDFAFFQIAADRLAQRLSRAK